MAGLTEKLERLPTWQLAPKLMASQMRGVVHRALSQLGLRAKAVLDEADLVVPDSALAQQALALVAEVSPVYLLNHSLRTFAFGAVLGRRETLRFDRELFFLAAIMHDLGLTDRFEGPAPFELQGARAARGFLLEKGVAETKADCVHEAIALHARVGEAEKGSPEGRLVHFGAGVDVAGFRIYDLRRQDVDRVVARWPREQFKSCFCHLMQDQARLKPQSNIAGLVGLGFTKMIEAGPFSE
ncbi:MAG: HD domain-containing protein [Rhizobiales bacterium]|nr:HD domain-containing protein [Hyphomicrobiales bacterium]